MLYFSGFSEYMTGFSSGIRNIPGPALLRTIGFSAVILGADSCLSRLFPGLSHRVKAPVIFTATFLSINGISSVPSPFAACAIVVYSAGITVLSILITRRSPLPVKLLRIEDPKGEQQTPPKADQKQEQQKPEPAALEVKGPEPRVQPNASGNAPVCTLIEDTRPVECSDQNKLFSIFLTDCTELFLSNHPLSDRLQIKIVQSGGAYISSLNRYEELAPPPVQPTYVAKPHENEDKKLKCFLERKVTNLLDPKKDGELDSEFLSAVLTPLLAHDPINVSVAEEFANYHILQQFFANELPEEANALVIGRLSINLDEEPELFEVLNSAIRLIRDKKSIASEQRSQIRSTIALFIAKKLKASGQTEMLEILLERHGWTEEILHTEKTSWITASTFRNLPQILADFMHHLFSKKDTYVSSAYTRNTLKCTFDYNQQDSANLDQLDKRMNTILDAVKKRSDNSTLSQATILTRFIHNEMNERIWGNLWGGVWRTGKPQPEIPRINTLKKLAFQAFEIINPRKKSDPVQVKLDNPYIAYLLLAYCDLHDRLDKSGTYQSQTFSEEEIVAYRQKIAEIEEQADRWPELLDNRPLNQTILPKNHLKRA